MRRRTWLEVTVAWLVASGAAAAEPAPVTFVLSCRPEAAPGRVLCELRCSADPGSRLAWADALVTRAPDFARPLRARVTPERFKEATAAERKLSLAFVAASSGVGTVTVRARAVVCRGEGEGESCRPDSRELTAELRVGG